MTDITNSLEWSSLVAHASWMQNSHIKDLFAQDEARAQKLMKNCGELHFDFSKHLISDETVSLFKAYADMQKFEWWRERLLKGKIVNSSERRPALHTALRDRGPQEGAVSEEVCARVKSEREALYQMAERIRSGNLRAANGERFEHIIFLGIGGSSLGPALLMDAFGFGRKSAFDVHIVSNIDGHALVPVLDACDAQKTLLLVASKTFTTTETLTNAKTVLEWMKSSDVTDLTNHLVAVTAAPETAIEYGIPKQNILTFADWVGGRYSLWSAISVPVVLAFGPDVFDAFLDGAEQMDRHFTTTAFENNIPVLGAILDIWYGNFLGAQSRALFVYDDRLALLPDYLQQLETESNGKDRTKSGDKVCWQTSPILWGGVGTDCQHSVFQLMHQGTHLVPAEFIGVIKPDHGHSDHHQKLLANMLAQSAALMSGRPFEAAKIMLSKGGAADEGETLDHLAASKSFDGNRPSTTILMDELTPAALGGLIAYYEHKTFVAGVLLDINSYDQMGVELGKELANELEPVVAGAAGLPHKYDGSTDALIRLIHRMEA